MRDELATIVSTIARDQAIRSVIITGAGGDFCSGGDIRAMQDEVSSSEQGRERLRGSAEWMTTLLNLDKPVITAIDGYAAGAGLSLALVGDLILASDGARFICSFGRMGLIPDYGGMYGLIRIVGQHRARELILTAREFDAAEAMAMGMLYEITSAEALMGRANELALAFAESSPAAIGLAKSMLNAAPRLDARALLEMEATGQGFCFSTEYHLDARKRFLGKEKLRFAWPTKHRGEPSAS